MEKKSLRSILDEGGYIRVTDILKEIEMIEDIKRANSKDDVIDSKEEEDKKRGHIPKMPMKVVFELKE